jgi:hypothetical protein
MPAQAGIQFSNGILDSRIRGNDNKAAERNFSRRSNFVTTRHERSSIGHRAHERPQAPQNFSSQHVG